MSDDITYILSSWPYDPDNLTRIIRVEDGRKVLQVRQPLGIEQYELEGRPDGETPHGFESYLDYYLERIEEYVSTHGTVDGFSLSHEDFLRLQNEGIIYYYRYLVLFQMSDFERTARDTDHNLSICEIAEKFTDEEDDKKELLQYKPYILRINAISKAMISLNKQLKDVAAQILESAIELIKKMPNIESPAFQFEKLRSLHSLQTTLRQIRKKKISPVAKLKSELDQAVEEENYERAAELRDKIRQIEIKERSYGERE